MKTGLLRTLENLMVAVTFAEKNDHEYAIRVMNPETERKNQKYQKKDLNRQRENRPRIQL
ncbi:MAG: hypothetical protein A2277_10900 [Desulfobacterales bacterium RIFOXYA12_FULL_46_15]|nr:MAG: hypothetical protein A2277_10900 [Desulfobacterales bacterium RIFOXYA12_FULL_46_15]